MYPNVAADRPKVNKPTKVLFKIFFKKNLIKSKKLIIVIDIKLKIYKSVISDIKD